MKKIIAIFACLLLIGCTNNDSDIEKFKEEYESLNAETGIAVSIDSKADLKYLSLENTYELLSSGTGIIYFGFPKCPWCRNIIPVLLDTALKNNMTVSYFNPSEVRDSNDQTFAHIMGLLYEYLEEDEDGQKILYVPDVYFIKDGKIVGHHLSSVDSQKDPRDPLTDEQRNELSNIYQEFINQIK